MGSFALFAVLLMYLITIDAEDTHLLQYKSPNTLLAECHKYLEGSQFQDQCREYCGGILIRVYNLTENTMESSLFMRFFNPDVLPKDHFSDVEKCFDVVRNTVPSDDRCQLVKEYQRCLRRNADGDRVRLYFIPRTQLQYRRAAADCVSILQIPPEELREIYHQGLTNHPRGRCLIRCFLIREQLYSEQLGVNPFRAIIQSGQSGDHENHREYREQARTCAARLQGQFLDRCSLAARIATECLGKELPKIIDESVRSLMGVSCI